MTALYHGSAWQEDLTTAIGNTPLIRLRGASDATGCTVLGKAEFMNPGGSVKDRAGLYIIADAERRPGAIDRRGQAGFRCARPQAGCRCWRSPNSAIPACITG